MTYIPPGVYSTKFTCPHCGAIAHQKWKDATWDFHGPISSTQTASKPIRVACRAHCNERSLWYLNTMVHPDIGSAPQPNADLPAQVKKLYYEASSISSKSPRGSAALLRLAVQVLCKELGGKGKDLNMDIATLVKEKGLPERVQQSLDIVRVTGNNAVHPGQIDVDDPVVVSNLFEIINVIADYTISMPKKIGQLYSAIPDNAKEQINRRDERSSDSEGGDV